MPILKKEPEKCIILIPFLKFGVIIKRGYMGKRTTVNVPTPNGMVQKEGTIVDVVNSSEVWSSYELEDGTVLKVKQVLVKVVKLDEKDIEGKPIYLTEAQPIVSVQ